MIYDSKKIHMVGIKGVGMTALAELLVGEKKHITGSDTSEEFFTDAVLKRRGIVVRPFSAQNISAAIDLVIRSSAYGDDHPEIIAAKKQGISIMSYSDAVAELFNAKRGILITGTHGKTTTTAIIGCVLEDAGFDPSVLVGAMVLRWKKNARVGKSEWFVAEGDEYQNKFLSLRPEVLVVTSIEYDHPDFFKTEKDYQNAFLTLISTLPSDGLLVAEKRLKRIIQTAPCRIVWYGIRGNTNGRHGELNRAAAVAVAKHLGISPKKAKATLGVFEGTARRRELYTAPDAPIVVIDDYGHHPTEIKTTLAAVRAQYPKRELVALFQPHTYSRTDAFLDDFSRAFGDADTVVVLPIYSSAREQKEDFPQDLEEQLRSRIEKRRGKNVFYMSFAGAIQYCKTLPQTKRKRVIITLGAGDGWKIAKELTSQPRAAYRHQK